jgi:hypothetical protein
VRTVAEPGRCYVLLTSGGLVELRADSYAEQEGKVLFSMLMEGRPTFEYVVATFPSEVVEKVWGGPVDV